MAGASDEAQRLSKEFQKLRQRLSELRESHQKLIIQQTENTNVLKVLQSLEADAVVYKLVGPVLVRQPEEEATANVTKRLSYIQTEIERASKLESEAAEQCKQIAGKLMAENASASPEVSAS
eukprot:GHVS01039017.1.p1 GENE.GHVS01039017.1~~GHVS01039017.1.p1  ORF type:complete len:122 (-),score=22.57 GHVS01039017.1:120-485(-)